MTNWKHSAITFLSDQLCSLGIRDKKWIYSQQLLWTMQFAEYSQHICQIFAQRQLFRKGWIPFHELMLEFAMRTCFLPSIRSFTKMLQIREFVNSNFCGCCIIRDFIPKNQNISTGNLDTSNAAYTSQQEQNYATCLYWVSKIGKMSYLQYPVTKSRIFSKKYHNML